VPSGFTIVTGSILVNLDSEEDGRLTVGCAGSTDTWLSIDEPREVCEAGATTLSVSVSGGLGGHSRPNIAQGRANAIKVLARSLREAYAVAPFRLVSLDGGKSRNAIPRDAVAICSVSAEREASFRRAVAGAGQTIRDAYAKTDPGVAVTVDAAAGAADAWPEEGTATLLDTLALVPTGPRAMSPDFAGLVETSTSLGEASTEGWQLTLHSLSRSSNDSALPELISGLDAAARLAGGVLEVKRNYGGWRPTSTRPHWPRRRPSTSGSSARLRSSPRFTPGWRRP
jgi:dipeptidase D